MVEVKETKRWADVEDSDEDLTTSKQNEYKSVHALDASAPHQQRCADVVRTDSEACSKRLEPEAIAADKWQKFMVEVKEAKRWADVEDSEGDLTTNVATEQATAAATALTTAQAALAKAKYKCVHAPEAAAPFQQYCADMLHTDSIRASQAAEQVMKGFYCAFANAMLPDQEAQALVVVQHSER